MLPWGEWGLQSIRPQLVGTLPPRTPVCFMSVFPPEGRATSAGSQREERGHHRERRAGAGLGPRSRFWHRACGPLGVGFSSHVDLEIVFPPTVSDVAFHAGRHG